MLINVLGWILGGRNMNTIIICLICYFIGMLAIGFFASKKAKTASDYMTGSGSFGVVLTAIAHQAAGLSGWLFLGFSTFAATSGVGAVWSAISSGGAPITNFLLLARRMRKYTIMTKARSVIDLLEARFYDESKKYIRVIMAVIILICMAAYIGSQVMAAGKTFQVVLGWDYNMSVVLAAVIVMLYTSAGGMLAVVWTDFVQGLLMIFAVACGVMVTFSNIGTPVDVVNAMGAIDPVLTQLASNPWTVVGLLAAGYMGYTGQPQIIQMFMGMKDPKDGKKGAVIAGATALFLLFGGLFTMMGARVLVNNVDDHEINFLLMMLNYLPSALVGVVCAGILAAVMSSADALLHVANTTLVQDVYNKIVKKGQASDKELLLVSRISGLLIGIVAIYIAFNPFEGVLWVSWWAFGGLTTFGPIVLLGLYWKRATREGAIAGMSAGFLASVLWFASGNYAWLHLSFIAFVVCFVVTVVVSLVTPAPPQYIQDQVDELAIVD